MVLADKHDILINGGGERIKKKSMGILRKSLLLKTFPKSIYIQIY